MPKEVIALALVLSASLSAVDAGAFVPPSFQAAPRGYRELLGKYRLIELGQGSISMPIEVRMTIGETTIEITLGTTVEKATYRVVDHYGSIYRLEVTAKAKKELLEILVQNDQITLYELDKDGHDKTTLRFERIP